MPLATRVRGGKVRSVVRFVHAAVVSAAVSTSQVRSAHAEPNVHDGLYARVTAAASWIALERSTQHTGSPTSIAYLGDSSRVGGEAPTFELSVGGTPFPGIVLAGTVLLASAPGAPLELADGSRVQLSSPLGFLVLAPSVDIYPDEGGGLHLGTGLGYVRAWATVHDPVRDAFGGNGAAFTAFLGYDFWAADEWSVGLQARGILAGLRGGASVRGGDVSERDTALVATIGATVVYH